MADLPIPVPRHYVEPRELEPGDVAPGDVEPGDVEPGDVEPGDAPEPASARTTDPRVRRAPERAPSARPPRVLRRLEDLHLLAYHGLCLAAYALAFWLYLEPGIAGIEGPASKAAFVAAAALLLGWISGVDVGVVFHNHVHHPVFTRPWMNRWAGRLWTFSGGWPSYLWWHAHLVVHHAHLLGERDWTVPRRAADGTTESLYRYALVHWPWRYAVHLARDLGAAPARIRRRVATELAIFAALWSIPFWIDVEMALWLWVLPQYLGNVAVMGPGMYAQHAGCAPATAERPHGHSNTFLNRLFNVTMFNIGYHIEHHEQGGLHWADLPAAHAERAAELAAADARVVPVGYYRAGQLLSRAWISPASRARFERRHPSFPRHEP